MASISYPVIGVDESGKGDFFGPLVIAGCLVEEEQLDRLAEIGVRDSKKIANAKLLRLADQIKSVCCYDIVAINPEKYNELYDRIKNLNKLLGWGHARVIENILSKQPAPTAISDKFGADHFIRSNLQKQGRSIELIQMVRGEAQPPVAAASILARAEFLHRMDSLSKQTEWELPRGAGSIVDDAARQLVNRSGAGILDKIAKRHFKNYKKVLC